MMLLQPFTLLMRFLLDVMGETRYAIVYNLLEGEILSMDDVADPMDPEMLAMQTEDVMLGDSKVAAGISDGERGVIMFHSLIFLCILDNPQFLLHKLT